MKKYGKLWETFTNLLPFQIEIMDEFFDPKGRQGTNQLMFFYQEPEDKDQHGKAFVWNDPDGPNF